MVDNPVAQISVNLSATSSHTVTANFTGYINTSTGEQIVTNQILTFAPGEISQAITLTIVPEWLVEPVTDIHLLLTTLNNGEPSGQSSSAILHVSNIHLYLPLIQQDQ